MVEFPEEVVHLVEVGAHLGLLGPALAHDVDGLGWSCALRYGRPNQRRGLLHLLDNLCIRHMNNTITGGTLYNRCTYWGHVILLLN